MDDTLSLIIKGYRANETLPLKLSREEIIKFARAAGEGQKLGMPSIGTEQLANKILLEGRSDAGTNEFNVNNPRAKKLYDSLVEMGIDKDAAVYPAAVLDKTELAKRLNIPFEQAWNGLGRSSSTGRTGKQHAQRAEQHKKAANDPRNTELVDLVSRAVANNLTPQERLLDLTNNEIAKAITGVTSEQPGYREFEKAIRERIFTLASDVSAAAGNDKTIKKNLTEGREPYVRDLVDTYRYVSGIRGDSIEESIAQEQLKKPIVKIMLGLDPGGQQYIQEQAAARQAEKAANPGILDRILSFVGM